MKKKEKRSVGRPTTHDEESLLQKLESFVAKSLIERRGYMKGFASYSGISVRQLRRKAVIVRRLQECARKVRSQAGANFWL